MLLMKNGRGPSGSQLTIGLAAMVDPAAMERGVARDQLRMEALGRSRSMRVGYRVMLDDALRRGVNFVFAGAVIGKPAALAVQSDPAAARGRVAPMGGSAADAAAAHDHVPPPRGRSGQRGELDPARQECSSSTP